MWNNKLNVNETMRSSVLKSWSFKLSCGCQGSFHICWLIHSNFWDMGFNFEMTDYFISGVVGLLYEIFCYFSMWSSCAINMLIKMPSFHFQFRIIGEWKFTKSFFFHAKLLRATHNTHTPFDQCVVCAWNFKWYIVILPKSNNVTSKTHSSRV